MKFVIWFKFNKKATGMFMLYLMMVLSCIPKEDPPKKQLNLEIKNRLPAGLNENSGMIFFDDLIWFINDSGNDTALFGYDAEQDTIVKKVVIKNTSNIDWEDITQNNDYIFIGDFGNNSGSRSDLRIIRINKSDLQTGVDSLLPFGLIEFTYEDQTDYTPSMQKTSFDCEGFIALEDKLLIFTKDWLELKTGIYSVPVDPGNYSATLEEKWNVQGLITSAAFSKEKKELLLLGYTPLVPFLWIYSDFNVDNLSFSSESRTNFNDFSGVQTEGILIMENGSVFISSEENNYPPTLFFLTPEQY